MCDVPTAHAPHTHLLRTKGRRRIFGVTLGGRRLVASELEEEEG